MNPIRRIFDCNQVARFALLFVIFAFSFILNVGHWRTLAELILVSSFIPFYGYVAFVFGRYYIRVLYYRTKPAHTDVDLTAIARKENPRINKVVIKEIDRIFVYCNDFTNSIVISSKLVSILEEEEILAILYHEIAHGVFYSKIRRILTSILVIPAFILLYFVSTFVVYAVVLPLQGVLSSSYLGFVSSLFFCVMFWVVERKNFWAREYKADLKAAEKVGKNLMISALKKSTLPENMNCDFPTHPSTKRRIAFLESKASSKRKNL